MSKLIEYRLYEDLRKGWRIVQPNLEQCGLLEIEYDELEAVCSDRNAWTKHSYSVLLQATPEQRLQEDTKAQLSLDADTLQQCFEDLDRILSDRYNQ